MFRDMRCAGWIVAAAILVIAQSATETVQAQLFWDQQYQSRRAGPRSGGFFDNFFGPYNPRTRDDEYAPPRAVFSIFSLPPTPPPPATTNPPRHDNGSTHACKSRLKVPVRRRRPR